MGWLEGLIRQYVAYSKMVAGICCDLSSTSDCEEED